MKKIIHVFDVKSSRDRVYEALTTQRGLELTDDVYGRFNFNWGYYLQSLKKLCETGKGFPYGAS